MKLLWIPETETLIGRLIRNFILQSISGLQIPNYLNLSNNECYEATLKALEKSNKTASTMKPTSYHFDTILKDNKSWSSTVHPRRKQNWLSLNNPFESTYSCKWATYNKRNWNLLACCWEVNNVNSYSEECLKILSTVLATDLITETF